MHPSEGGSCDERQCRIAAHKGALLCEPLQPRDVAKPNERCSQFGERAIHSAAMRNGSCMGIGAHRALGPSTPGDYTRQKNGGERVEGAAAPGAHTGAFSSR